MHCLLVCGFVCTVDQNVIHVDGHLSFCDQICEDYVYECLESGRQVGKAKVYDAQFKGSTVSDEGCISLICFLNSDIVVTPPDIKLSKDLGFGQVVDDIRNER